MPSKYMLIAALSFMAVLIFGAGFKLGQNHEVLKPYTQAKAEQHGKEDQPDDSIQANTNRIAAIMIMPRSYLPLLEKFKHSKVARRIEILPALIDQQDSRLVAISQRPIRLETDYSEANVKNSTFQNRSKPQQKTPRIAKITQGAAILCVLKYAAKSKPRYVAHQSIAQNADL